MSVETPAGVETRGFTAIHDQTDIESYITPVCNASYHAYSHDIIKYPA